MTRVKICGITNLHDALDAVEAGADALGFVFYKASPRYISPVDAKAIVDELPPFVERVGLFVNEDAAVIDKICHEAGIELAQIHFDAPDGLYEALSVKYLKVVRAQTAEDLHRYEDEYRIVDAFVEGYGGAGKRIDPSWFEGVDCSKMILAGGLTAENVLQMRRFGFYAFDVSSGVEQRKGKKDKIEMKKFIKAVRNGKI